MKKTPATAKRARSVPVPQQVVPIVGIGASAGGVEAFTQLLHHLPNTTGMGFVLIQHLDSKHESVLQEILARATKMPVLWAADKALIQPDHVYIIPPNADLETQGGRFSVQPRTVQRGLHLPVDRFLRSLAADRGSMALGVILSGTASDGTLGLKAIKAEGGITFAQSETTAKYPGMPNSAIAAGAVDYVLSPEAIGGELARVGKHPYVHSTQLLPAAVGREADLARLFQLLRNATAVDFSHYKPATVGRRITRRMVVRKVATLHNYLAYIDRHPAEIQDLYQDLLIKVTGFFRDQATFRVLRKTICPRLVRNRSVDEPVRVWVAGCATGEEAYSLAIALTECMREFPAPVPVQIFATDISETVIERARAGIYPRNIAADVPSDLLRHYFVPVDGGYQVIRTIRDKCVFARQNLVRDPPFSKLDMISCRNLLIYLDPVLQRRAMNVFQYALKPGGYLVLGTSETVGTLSELFTLVDKKNKVYTRKPGLSRLNLEFPSPVYAGQAPSPSEPPSKKHVPDGAREVDRLLIDRYSPPAVVINRSMQVLQFRGRTGRYLEPEPGEANLNLFRMVREGLLPDLRAVVEKAIKKKAPARIEKVQVRSNGGFVTIDIDVTPFGADGDRYLVVFEEPPTPSESVPTKAARPAKFSESREIRRLKQELAASKHYLQSVIEEQETNNEELKSANEEIQSANEELQSTNEEMETAKEELQSTNEELTTVNEELNTRNGELAHANNDLNNLLVSVQLPLVMVGHDLRLRRFTPAAEKLLNLIPTDLGRPLLDIKPNIELPDLPEILRDVIDNLRVVEREVRDRTGRFYSMWVRPYRTTENKIDGAVLALLDVTPLQRSLAQSRDLREYAEAIASTLRQPFVALDPEFRVVSANAPFYKTFSISREVTENRNLFELGDGDWNIPRLRAVLADPASEGFLQGFEVEHTFKQAGRKVLSINIRRLPAKGPARIALLAIEDVTARRFAEEALLEAQTQYSTLAREAPVGILQSDNRGECTFANIHACQIAGVTSAEALGRGWLKHIHLDDLALFQARLEDARHHNQGLSLDLRFQKPDALTWAHLVLIPLGAAHGANSADLIALTDITGRKDLEDRLIQSQKMEAIGRLAGGVAHDFNNMLTAINSYSQQLLDRVPEDHPARKPAVQLGKVTEQAAMVTRQLLAFSRRQVLRPQPVSLNAVLRDMHDLLNRVLGDSIEIVLQLAPDARTVVVDPGQIHQVIFNLAINARDAMPNGGSLTIATGNITFDRPTGQKEELPPGDYGVLCLTDTGVGMDGETKEHLFEPFFTTKPAGAGTGLGLSMSYGIVHQSGGTIRFESEPGKGTTVRIYLPRAGDGVEPPNPQHQPEIRGGSETILVVEDAQVVRSLVRELLENRGYTVLEARDGQEALSLAENHDGSIHLLLTDLLMPRVGGHELAKRIRRRRNIKVIYMSGYSGDALHAVEKEADFLEKPFKPDALASLVRKVLDRKLSGKK